MDICTFLKITFSFWRGKFFNHFSSSGTMFASKLSNKKDRSPCSLQSKYSAHSAYYLGMTFINRGRIALLESRFHFQIEYCNVPAAALFQIKNSDWFIIDIWRMFTCKWQTVGGFTCLAWFLFAQQNINCRHFSPGGGTWVNFCWVCAAGLSRPLPHYSLFCSQL